MARKVLTEQEVRNLPPGSPFYIERGALLTPLAREVALARQNSIVECDNPTQMKSFERLIALGADHEGWALRQQIQSLLQDNNYWIVDCGAPGAGKAEALDLTLQVAKQVRDGKVRWGIMIDGTGLTSCLVANKVPGIRAVHCYDRLTAKSSRECSDSNLLTLAALTTTSEQANLIVMTWLNTSSGKGGPDSQFGKIAEIEQRLGRG